MSKGLAACGQPGSRMTTSSICLVTVRRRNSRTGSGRLWSCPGRSPGCRAGLGRAREDTGRGRGTRPTGRNGHGRVRAGPVLTIVRSAANREPAVVPRLGCPDAGHALRWVGRPYRRLGGAAAAASGVDAGAGRRAAQPDRCAGTVPQLAVSNHIFEQTGLAPTAGARRLAHRVRHRPAPSRLRRAVPQRSRRHCQRDADGQPGPGGRLSQRRRLAVGDSALHRRRP
jgi:hypothetical protein